MKNNIFCLYISDLHVNKKKKIKSLLKKKKNEQIKKYFQNQIQNLVKTIPTCASNKIRIFIVGDVSSNFELFKFFFDLYCQKIKIKTYFVLGNHEFKALFYEKKNYNYPQIVDCYQKFLSSLGIEMLEDHLIIENNDHQVTKFSIQEILKLNTTEIKNIFVNSFFSVLGSFSGSEILSQVHCKLRKIVPNTKLIITTHLPLKNWLQDQINFQWIYLYGHTHHNVVAKSCYADNQIGVKKELKFKSFTL